MPPFSSDNILVIVPGSQTTLAELRIPDPYSPPTHRFPTRVFLSPDGKTYEPHRIRSRKKENSDEEELVEDPEDEEGAIYPLKQGRIVNKNAFFALLQHIHNTFSPPLNTPILLATQPCWTIIDHENIADFLFEKFKPPGLILVASAIAVAWAFNSSFCAVIDVGFEKVDVTAVVNTALQVGAQGSVPDSGGEAMTQRLVQVLKPKEFTRDMAEQLKKSAICEILPQGTPLPVSEGHEGMSSNAAPPISGLGDETTEASRDAKVGYEAPINGEEKAEDDGVLDVASIVASGKTQEFLAKKEKEKAEKEKGKSSGKKNKKEKETRGAADAAKTSSRVPNSKKPLATFNYEASIHKQSTSEPTSAIEPTSVSGPASVDDASSALSMPAESKSTEEAAVNATLLEGPAADSTASRKEQLQISKRDDKRKRFEEEHPDRTRREIEIGSERFMAASASYMYMVADTVYRTIQAAAPDARQTIWDNLIIIGNGSKIRGFQEALLTELKNRYLISPSSATMFMSELPSNMATPSGTGSMTPNASFSSTPNQVPTVTAVNPLLLAATTANAGLAAGNSAPPSIHGAANGITMHSSRSQTPTNIGISALSSNFSEWKSSEEADFLGAQLMAKNFFVENLAAKMYITREEFNTDGPAKALRALSFL